MNCEYCNTPMDEDEGCPSCLAEMKRQQDFYGALFANQPRYTREEIEDVYSDATDAHKRETMLNELGEN